MENEKVMQAFQKKSLRQFGICHICILFFEFSTRAFPICIFKKNNRATHSAKSSAVVDVQLSNSTGRPVDSRGRPVEFLLDIQ